MPGGRTDPVPGFRRPGSRDLPVRRHKARIVEKVLENRVTLIFADTGSGKSSQVPQMLLEEGLGPILCTQPRRLAVVAVAKRVAEERGCALGDDVGYQIGQLNLSTTRTKIVFKTAGILFEELRTNGTGALSKYKIVILDEVHERSVESDLVLTCLKQLLRTTGIKLVLMSATADLLKYEEYFKEIDRGEGVEKIAIQSLAEKFQSVILNTKVVYLEQAVKLLGSTPQHTSVLDAMNASFAPAEKGNDIGNTTQNLMKDLIVHLHHSEADISKNVLVFLPTYRALEQQWLLLKATCEPFQVHVLHSSIDMERSIRAMEACPPLQRKIILATNVAESSITISGVSFVIDSCRSLEVYWDSSLKKHQTRIVWVSESQATQRKGRTGRTCDGVVYRLVPRNHFLRFEKFETPAMQLLSLRKQVLMILCASSKALNDPAGLLRKCMNPPASETVQDALETLADMNAIYVDTKGKHQATLYGQLLVSLPLSLESSVLVVRGGQLGYPRESVVLAAILDSTPNPILKPFGDLNLYKLNLGSYYMPSNNEEGQCVAPPHSTIMLANLLAYEFWQQAFKDKQRLDLLLLQARNSRLHINGFRSSDQDTLESDWCTQHNLSLTSLRSVSETVDIIMEALHRFRPKFLSEISGPPPYIKSGMFQHACCTRARNDDTMSRDTSDAWNGWSSEELEVETSDDGNGKDQGNDSPTHHEGKSDSWNDWSFQVSERQLNGHGKANDQCGSHTQVNGTEECRPNGIVKSLDESHGNGQVVSSDQFNDHTHVKGSNQWNGNGKVIRSQHYAGNGQVNVGDQYNGNEQFISDAEGHGSNDDNDLQPCLSVPYTRSATFHSLEDEQILSALVVEVSPRGSTMCQTGGFDPPGIHWLFPQVQRGNQQSIVLDVDGQTLGDRLPGEAPFCSFFQKGLCNKGANCLFSHSPSAKPVLCRFFNTPTGCRYGSMCRYSHNDPARFILPSFSDPINFDEQTPTAQSMLDLLPVLKENEFVLLFGEGDFSFADSLSNFIDPRKIFATSLDKEDIFLKDPDLGQRLRKLTRLHMQVMWNVDVTSLITCTGKDKRIVSVNLTKCIPWSRVRCVLWNFPFADIDENANKHQNLIHTFFASLSIIMMSLKVQSIPVIITLCNDQYCRWQVERAARNSFFFPRTSVPFDVQTFGGYCPVRNNLQSTFPVQRPLIYVFDLYPPINMMLGEGLREEFMESSEQYSRLRKSYEWSVAMDYGYASSLGLSSHISQ